MSLSNEAPVSRSSAIIAFSLGTLFFGYAFLQRVSPSVMTSELMRDFSVGGAALGSLSAFYFYAYASIQLPVGMLTDRFGPRKLMGYAVGLCALASVGFAFSDSVFSASIARAFIGVTVAFAFVGTLAIAGYWFKPAQYAMLAGVLQTVGMSGAIFGQAPLRAMVESIGWRGAMIFLAILAVMLSLGILTLVPKRSRKQRDHEVRSSVMKGLQAVVSNPQSWFCAMIGFGLASTMLGFGALWGVPWLTTVQGYSTTQAAGITSMIFAGWAVSSPLLGWVSDHSGRRNIILIIGAMLSLSTFSWVVFNTPGNTSLLMLLLFLVGVGGSSMTVCFSSVKEHNSLGYSSTSLGLMNMFVVGAGAVMQPMIGWLLDMNWDGAVIDGARIYPADAYTLGFSSLLAATLLALIGALLLKETRCKQLVA